MTSKKTMIVGLIIGVCLQWAGVSLLAQGGDKFKTRLSPAPALGIQPATVQGTGAASATLSGRKLSISGSFEKMASPATVGHLCLGQLAGVRGECVFDIAVTKTGDGKTGTIAAALDLTPQQVEALRKGRFYVQIHSEGVPTGHLLGWLLK